MLWGYVIAGWERFGSPGNKKMLQQRGGQKRKTGRAHGSPQRSMESEHKAGRSARFLIASIKVKSDYQVTFDHTCLHFTKSSEQAGTMRH